ncbi:MAG: hypothetical protein ACRC7N_20040, partial [Clostridium sp.]
DKTVKFNFKWWEYIQKCKIKTNSSIKFKREYNLNVNRSALLNKIKSNISLLALIDNKDTFNIFDDVENLCTYLNDNDLMYMYKKDKKKRTYKKLLTGNN